MSVRVVVRIGGSILFPHFSQTRDFLREYANAIKKSAEKVEKLVIVVGGGAPARFYINLTDNIANSFTKDLLGIKAARLNASVIREFTSSIAPNLKIAPTIFSNGVELVNSIDVYDVFFCGGFRPGQSTTGVAALTVEAIKADYLGIATDVNGVYDKKPNKPGAERFKEISIQHLIEILASRQAKAGTYELLDLPALKIIERTRIPVIVFNGTSSENLIRVIDAFNEEELEKTKDFGTLITF